MFIFIFFGIKLYLKLFISKLLDKLNSCIEFQNLYLNYTGLVKLNLNPIQLFNPIEHDVM